MRTATTADSTHSVPLPLRVDLAERIRENRFSRLPDSVRLDELTELQDVVPPPDLEPIDQQAQWLLLYGIGVL